MIGLRFWFLLGTCIYPDEPALPKAIHVRRMLASAVLAIVYGVLSFVLSSQGGVLFYVMVLMLLENVMIFSYRRPSKKDQG